MQEIKTRYYSSKYYVAPSWLLISTSSESPYGFCGSQNILLEVAWLTSMRDDGKLDLNEGGELSEGGRLHILA